MAHGNNNMIGYRKISSTSFAFLSSAECLKSDDGQTDDFLIHSYLLQVVDRYFSKRNSISLNFSKRRNSIIQAFYEVLWIMDPCIFTFSFFLIFILSF